jgi:hypothetical protein
MARESGLFCFWNERAVRRAQSLRGPLFTIDYSQMVHRGHAYEPHLLRLLGLKRTNREVAEILRVKAGWLRDLAWQ